MGKHNVRINAGVQDEVEQAKTLKRKRTSTVDVEDAIDQVVDPTYYIANFGHWSTNGRGHRYGTLEGKTRVIVPAPPIKSIRRKRGCTAELSETVNDGSVQLTADSMNEQFDTMSGEVRASIPQGVGQPLDLSSMSTGGMASGIGLITTGGLHGGSSSQPPPSPAKDQYRNPPIAGTPPRTMPPDAEAFGSNAFGFAFSDAPPAAVVQQSSEEATAAAGEAKGRKKKGAPAGPPPTPSARRPPSLVDHLCPHLRPPSDGICKKKAGRTPYCPMSLTDQQAESYLAVNSADAAFFGAGSKAHKGYLKMIKTKLDLRGGVRNRSP